MPRFHYAVSVELVLNNEDFEELFEAALSHYDPPCRLLTRPGGWLREWKIKRETSAGAVPLIANSPMLELLAKCVEKDSSRLQPVFMEHHRHCQIETQRLRSDS